MNALFLTYMLLLMVGAGLIVHAGLSYVNDTWNRLAQSKRIGRLYQGRMGEALAPLARPSEEEVLGLKDIPWNNIQAGAALVGILFIPFLRDSAIFFRFLPFALPGLVILAKRYLLAQRRGQLIWKVRQFLLDLRLHMSLQGSLLLGLENIARTTQDSSPVYAQLKKRVLGSSALSGMDLLQQLADDLDSNELTKAVQRIQAAQAAGGVKDVDAAIAKVIDELTEEISYRTDEQLQKLPMRITLLSMPFLLIPILLLLFYPLVDRVLKTLGGVSVGGGF